MEPRMMAQARSALSPSSVITPKHLVTATPTQEALSLATQTWTNLTRQCLKHEPRKIQPPSPRPATRNLNRMSCSVRAEDVPPYQGDGRMEPKHWHNKGL